MGTRGWNSAIRATELAAGQRGRARRRDGSDQERRARRCPTGAGTGPGSTSTCRLTAPDGYQAQRSYSIASGPEDDRLVLTVERLDDGEVSPYLTDELIPGDELELRGPIGGYFVWEEQLGGPLLMIAGGSGVVPFRSMLRHREAVGSDVAGAAAVLGALARTRSSIATSCRRFDAADGVQVDVRADAPVARRLDRPPRPDRCGAAGARGVAARASGRWPTSAGPAGSSRRPRRRWSHDGHEPGRIRTERFGPTGT